MTFRPNAKSLTAKDRGALYSFDANPEQTGAFGQHLSTRSWSWKVIENAAVVCFLSTVALILPAMIAIHLAQPPVFSSPVGQEFMIDAFSPLTE